MTPGSSAHPPYPLPHRTMEPYGASGEEPRSDPGAQTGLEERMWRLELGGAKSYPQRPDEADCNYYLRTGFCGYGARCRFNHPPDRSAVLGATRAGAVEYPERLGQPVCQYYMRTATCKFGVSCKFHHPKQGIGSAVPVALNYYGFPLRPGEKECSYYVKTGQCKFGAMCKFHHPQPAGIQVPTPGAGPQIAPVATPFMASAVYPAAQSPAVHSSQQYGVVVARSPVLSSYGPYGSVLLSPSMVPYHGWSPYPATVGPVASPSTQPSTGSSSVYGVTQLSPPVSGFPGQYQPLLPSFSASSGHQKEQSFPERPGQPECQYYMKTGYCKYGSSCRYHHPPDLISQEASVFLSPIGLPLRPGAPPCTYFAQHGVCKYGRACKFNHPMGMLSYSPSASSLADMPVAPYPVGSSIGTLAPSSSSSELRPEVTSGSVREVSSTRSSSSMSASSASIASVLLKSETASHSKSQKSGQNPGSSPGNNSRTTEDRSSI
ncbi:zinc finger CCCH domain-containing protein 58-like isoform X2 [Rhodamnia argentea]|uniref:Zinc finger CCCH domain-containing protein 58-like isoform X2 n=1 Tax=Rhodamnia argentea TaxID=178133 RepID=A0A8B8QW73_9MYRT|nr:zinc finger CCCH domain-containing protein 58-like isoform X2 [Rhodamnia argentea]